MNKKKSLKKYKEEMESPVVYKASKVKKAPWIIAIVALTTALLAPTVMSTNVASYKQQTKNVRTIEYISNEEVNTEYRNACENSQNALVRTISKIVPTCKLVSRWQKQIAVNMFLDLDLKTQKLLNETISLFNEINKKTYTGLPKLVLNYKQEIVSDKNIFDISVSWGELPINQLAVTAQNPLLTLGSQRTLNQRIIIDGSLRKSPEYLSSVLIHELMHALFNFDDVYQKANYTTDTIMNYARPGQFLSINDIYLMNSIMWTKELTPKQQKEVKKFYKEYEQMYNACNGEIITELQKDIENQETLEN